MRFSIQDVHRPSRFYRFYLHFKMIYLGDKTEINSVTGQEVKWNLLKRATSFPSYYLPLLSPCLSVYSSVSEEFCRMNHSFGKLRRILTQSIKS